MGSQSTHTNHPPSDAPTPLNGQTSTHTQKWASFTYIGKETTYITNLFKKTDLKVALRTNNTIQKQLMQKDMALDKYTRSGTYKLTCPDCNKAYIGQTGRSFNERYKEHKNVFKTNSHTSNYAKHILEQSHTFGLMHQTMQILQYHEKGTHFNTIERFFIYAEFSKNNHLNDEHSIFPNKIFDALLKPHQPYKPPPPNPPIPKPLSERSHHLPATPTCTVP
jgi:hypothetical protein